MTPTRIRFPRHRKPAEPSAPPMPSLDVVERDDGWFEILPCGTGPFPTRSFAYAVWLRLRQTRHHPIWVAQ
jgi:hypothetical protein